MILTETLLKPFLARKKEKDFEKISSNPREIDSTNSLYDTNDPDIIATGFFDNTATFLNNQSDKATVLRKQADYIKTYREIANIPEVEEAINEIVNEAIFNPDTKYHSMDIDFSEETEIPDNLQDKIIKEFDIVLNKLNLEKNFYNLFYTYYVDGQLNIHLSYNEKNKDLGFTTIKTLSPMNLYFDNLSSKWKYLPFSDTASQMYNFNTNPEVEGDLEFDKEEIIRIDSGIFSDKIILSNLHKAIRPANMLKTLEDMLVPMRFSRSVSRRVFNVDVANLPESKVQQVMQNYKNTYKYTNFYNVEAGTITKQQHINSLVEDYWFPNRSGAKGTSVETLDESGNIGEITDILYFQKKLYKALRVPPSRFGDDNADFDFTAASMSREEIKFFAFISRLRTQFSELFYELLRRQLVFKGLVNESEWRQIQKDIFITYRNQNVFYENIKQDQLKTRYELYQGVKEDAGKIFSWEYILKEILQMTQEEYESQMDLITKEQKNPKFKAFYAKPDEGQGEI